MNILEIENLSFSYMDESHQAIKNLNLKVKKGEIISLVGDSGCGKSTLIFCLNGIIPKLIPGKLNGLIKICNKDIHKIPVSELHQDIQIMFQDPETQFFSFNVYDEIAFGLENQKLSERVVKIKVDEALELLNIQHLKNRTVEELSSGEKQKVILAALIAMKPKILVLDEPTANLDPLQTKNLAILLKKINKELGITIIISEHDLDFVKMSDRILYMQNGKLIKYSNQLNQNYIPYNKMNISNENILEIKDLCFQYNERKILKDINLELKKGEVLGIVGFNGSGKSTLVQNIVGLLKPSQGTIKYKDENITKTKLFQISQNVGYVFQNPNYSLFENKVIDELTFGPKNKKFPISFIKKTTQFLLKSLDLTAFQNKDSDNLSIGQKRRVTIASILSMQPSVLIIDEPDTGLDRQNSIKLSQILNELNKKGMSIILISHNLKFLNSICHRIVLLKNGIIKNSESYMKGELN